MYRLCAWLPVSIVDRSFGLLNELAYHQIGQYPKNKKQTESKYFQFHKLHSFAEACHQIAEYT